MKLELRRATVSTPGAADAKRDWPERQCLLVCLRDPGGEVGLGEASPLPGYSPDALDSAEQALRDVPLEKLVGALERESTHAALAAVSELLPTAAPSARMALETAALDWLARRAGVAAPALLGAETHSIRPLAQLLGPAASPSLRERATAALSAGYRHLKLKLGGAELERELDAVTALRESVGSSVALRLDANGALTLPELERAWPKLERSGLELFEEPGSSLPPSAGLPLALDESLQGASPELVERAIVEKQPRALVLKPMALGGLAHSWRLAQLAQRHGVLVVISHTFDGPFAWRAAAALALALPPHSAHGLAPHAGLAAWPANGARVRQGSVNAWSEPGLGLDAEGNGR
jgi:o-succinylbenzoate synthase